MTQDLTKDDGDGSSAAQDDARAHVTKHETTVHVQELIAAIQGNGQQNNNRMPWVAVVGVGTVLIMAIVPWMMWMIGEVIPANTQALVKMEAQSEDVESALKATRDVIIDLKDAVKDNTAAK